MQCDDVRDRLSAMVDGELGDPEREIVREHVRSCAGCAREESELRALDLDLHAALEPELERGAAVAEAVRARIAPRRLLRFPTLAVAMVAAAAAGFLVAVLSMRGGWGVAGGGASDPSAPAVATLELAVGGLEVRPTSSAPWTPLSTGAELAAGAEVRCGAKTKASFQLADGSELRVNRGTRLRFVDPRHVALAEGQVFARVAPAGAAGREFRVDAPAESRVVALGTQIDLVALERGVRLVTLQGLARLLDSAGAARDVSVGQQAEVREGAVGDVTPVRQLELLTTWHVELLSLRGRDDAELQAIVDRLLAHLGRTKMVSLYENEIRSLGSHCQLPLARYVESEESKKEEERRADAARILADVADASLRGDFLAMLSDPQAEVRYHAARALARIVGPAWSHPPELWRDGAPESRKSATEACASEFGGK